MSKICLGFLEIWSIICYFCHFEIEYGGHIGSCDLELGQRLSILSASFVSSDCFLCLCKVWLKYIGWLKRCLHFSEISFIHVKLLKPGCRKMPRQERVNLLKLPTWLPKLHHGGHFVALQLNFFNILIFIFF